MTLTILHDPGFKPLNTCNITDVDVDILPVTPQAKYHVDRLHPVWTFTNDRMREGKIPHVQKSGLRVETWVNSGRAVINESGEGIDGSNVLNSASSDTLRQYPTDLSPSTVSPGSIRSQSIASSSTVSESRSRIPFSSLPSEARNLIWTYHATDQTPRTVSTSSIIWVDGKPIDNNQPVSLHQISRETRAAKSALYGLHGYKVLHLSVLTYTTPRQAGYASILIHPVNDILHITNDFLSTHGTLLPSLHGLALMQDLHMCNNLLSIIQNLTLCVRDANFEFMISQLPHFTNLKMLFLVTGTHYVKVKKGEEETTRKNRFDTEDSAATIWWRPDGHAYLAEDFLARIIKPYYTWREQAGAIVNYNRRPRLFDQDVPSRIVMLRQKCPLPQLRIVNRVIWFSQQETLRRVRDRMALIGGGTGHFVLSEARYGRVREGKEIVRYEKRQILGERLDRAQRRDTIAREVLAMVLAGNCGRKRKRA